ncbi:hypothetical protein ACFLXT_01370 [Chloroflexota bacterium]
MNSETKNHRVTIVILLLAAVSVIIYLVSLKLAYPVFQNSRLADPLAELHSLFPLYYVAIGIMALLGVACFIRRIENRGIHLLLLLLLAVMLWYTPYHLAEFTRPPDGPRNLGVALQIPWILRGISFPQAFYGLDFPTSYILDYSLLHITGIEQLSYLHLFPFVCLCLFSLLFYVFASKLFSPLAAFVTVLLTMIGLHYIVFHSSAHAVGVLLLMTALVLLFRQDILSRVLTFLVIVAVIMCHPISPILLAVFLAAALVANFSRKVVKSQAVVAAMLVVCIAGWFIWPMLPLAPSGVPTLPFEIPGITTDIPSAISETPGVTTDIPSAISETPGVTTDIPSAISETPGVTTDIPSAISETPGVTTEVPSLPGMPSVIEEPGVTEEASEWAKKLQKYIFPSELKTTKRFLLGTPFIYEGIFNINKGIYILYALLAVTVVSYTIYRTRSQRKGLRNFFSKLGGLNRGEIFMAISVPLLVILTILLGEKAHVLIERSLTFTILAMSGLIASITTRTYESATIIVKRFICPAMIVIILFLTLSFPVVAYSIDAYTSFPISEEAGLKFLANYAPLDTKTLATTSGSQMTLYRPYIAAPVWLGYPWSLDRGDVFAFRMTGYYIAAMRHDLSFDDNWFTRYQSVVNVSSEFHRIYSSPTIDIFIKSE